MQVGQIVYPIIIILEITQSLIGIMTIANAIVPIHTHKFIVIAVLPQCTLRITTHIPAITLITLIIRSTITTAVRALTTTLWAIICTATPILLIKTLITVRLRDETVLIIHISLKTVEDMTHYIKQAHMYKLKIILIFQFLITLLHLNRCMFSTLPPNIDS
jgi:hypothetical protein